MTIRERASFDRAVRFNDQAADAYLKGELWRAAMLWHQAADFAVSDSAKAVLLLKSADAILELLAQRKQVTVH